jgi:4-carboxymuconolactone decarboxylase
MERRKKHMGNENFEHGLATRRAVVGDEAVDRAFEDADDFSMPMQELVTTFCWGEIWGRPGLDRRSRSILNLGMLAAANRPEELAGHIRGAINNGLTRDEIRECLLQVAVYVGMPAGPALSESPRMSSTQWIYRGLPTVAVHTQRPATPCRNSGGQPAVFAKG